jgi:hypothetical protein
MRVHYYAWLFSFFFFFEIESHYIAQGGLELMILLPLPPKFWDYMHMPPCLGQHYFLRTLSTPHR